MWLGAASQEFSETGAQPQTENMIRVGGEDFPHIGVAVRATFLMVGREVERYPELALEAFMDGNEVGNHTYSHPDIKKLSWADTVREISKAQDVFVRVLGFRPIYFRPPRGEFDNQDLEVAKAMGYKVVMWTVGVENRLMTTPQAMVDRVCAKVTPKPKSGPKVKWKHPLLFKE